MSIPQLILYANVDMNKNINIPKIIAKKVVKTQRFCFDLKYSGKLKG